MTTLRTVPSVLREVQEKQMPIRQPNSGREAGASACSRSGRAGVLGASSPERANADVALGGVAGVGGDAEVLKYSTRSVVAVAVRRWTVSISGAGPQAQVAVSR